MTPALLQDVKQPIGWNINPLDVHEGVFLDHVEGTKCHSHTVLHSLGFARKVYDIAARTTGLRPVIVFREDNKDQNVDDSRYRDLRAYARKFKTTEDYWDDAYIYVWNEPPAGGSKSAAAHILRRSIEACEAFADEGVKAVIGNFPCSDLYENYGDRKWVDEGLYDEALRVWSQWTNAGHGYIGEHGWYTFGLWSWTAGRNPFDMENPDLVTEDRWPTPDEVLASPDNWLMGRPFSTTLARCKVLGIEPYLSIGTEGGADWMPNAEAEGWAWSIQRELGIASFKRDGILKQKEMLAKMLRTDEPTAVIKNIRWLARLLRRARTTQVVHLFTLSKNSRWLNYDYSNWPEFWEPFYALADELQTEASPMPVPPAQPAPVTTVDLSQYLLGDGRVYKLAGMGDETLQTQFKDGYGYQVKNEHWEAIWFDANSIYRGMDTSPGNGNVYSLWTGSRYGSVWSPRRMTVGQTVKRSPTVIFQRAATGAEVVRYVDTTYLTFAAHHPTYTFQSGVTLRDVIELRAAPDVNGSAFETYFYAKGYGLVGWKGGGVGASYISGVPAPAPPIRETLSWFTQPVPPPVENISMPNPVPKPADAGSPERVTLKEDYSLRTGPGTTWPRVKAGAQDVILTAGTALDRFPKQVDGPINAGSGPWVWVETSSVGGWMADQNQFAPVFGEPTVLLDVPFVSQYGVDADGPNACGPASGAMAVNWKHKLLNAYQVTAKEFGDDIGHDPGEATTLEQIRDGLKLPLYDIQSTYHAAKNGNAATPAEMRAHLDSGGMVIVLFERGRVPGTQDYYNYTRAHISPLIGYGNGFFVLADPLAIDDRGKRLKVADADLTAAMASSTWQNADGSIGTNTAHQSLFVEAPRLPEPPVPPDLYAAVLAQAARLEHAHADLLTAQQAYTLAVAEVLESLRGIVGAS